ncbi:cytochrome P460 family protein [Luteibacter yeojuensis]|uniref:Cytochrome P460 family protein n=1 Tax=Luteibacter yeojuensis TaxID=345309 RepID=A0A7X5QST2_9GAMM|nr:cytochrome P460 family protein [Luteibacter yeojuensis]NID14684.1 cytochrome P460 family protein [Luteibacter yeojuensis]
MSHRNTVVILGMALAAVLACADVNAAGAKAKPQSASLSDASGNLHVPDKYRETYEYLGTWSVAASGKEGAKEMHVVYASPGTTAAYKKNGKFPDGAVLVKEVFEAATGPMTTGTVSHEQTLKGWFVMVKDDKNRHPDNKLWGEGWAWSWFDAGNPKKTTSTDYRTDCQACHTPAKSTDWIYVQGYPVLKN